MAGSSACGANPSYELHPAISADVSRNTPLVIMPGLGATSAEWAPFVAAARERAPVLFCDPAAQDASSARDPGETTLAGLTAELAALLEALHIEQAHVLGHSLGGVIALDFVLRHPGRVRALVLCSTTPEAEAPEQRAAKLRQLERGATRQLGERLLPAEGQPSEGAALPAASAAGTGIRTALARALITRPDQTPHLEGVRAPTLVLAGEMDPPSIQRGAELLHGWIPTSRLVYIAGAGHHAHREQPAEFERLVLSFLHEVDTYRPPSAGL